MQLTDPGLDSLNVLQVRARETLASYFFLLAIPPFATYILPTLEGVFMTILEILLLSVALSGVVLFFIAAVYIMITNEKKTNP